MSAEVGLITLVGVIAKNGILIVQLEPAAVRYRTATQRLQHLRDAAAASERTAALAVLRFEGGVADFLHVLDSERTTLAAQDQLAEGLTRAADAYVALFQARAGRWEGR
jgi:multidrug efflux system outer membrane protein